MSEVIQEAKSVDYGTNPRPQWAVIPLFNRLYAVWFRHMRVYTRNLFSNALPPFIEPLIFLAGIGLGLGNYVVEMDGIPYIKYLATGLLITAAMFTSAFECSFGTYIRLVFDKVYDGMLGAPVGPVDLMVGELLWVGTKGMFFTSSVLAIIMVFGIVEPGWILLSPLIGFLAGILFGSLALLITSIVDNISHFNFFFSGFISPMFFFSGVVFPIENLPSWTRPITEALPLTHPVRLVRGMAVAQFELIHLWDLGYMVLFVLAISAWAIYRLRKKLID